jgi:PPOX class probable F420-dependent enzyme
MAELALMNVWKYSVLIKQRGGKMIGKKKNNIIPETHYEILESKCYPIVATVRADGMISANPVSMLWDGNLVRFSTVKNRMKYKNMVNDSRLTLCISSVDDPLFYIEIRGRAEMEDDPDRGFINRVAQKYLGREEYPYDNPSDERVTVTIIPDQVSARGIRLIDDDQGKPVKMG